MAAGGTYSGTVVIPTQKGVAYGVNFDGLYIPAVMVPNDGFENENDYQHKGKVLDIGGNVQNKLYAGNMTRARGTLKFTAANATTVLALKQLSTISMQRVNTNGTLDAAENWMVESDPTFTFNREYLECDVVAIKEPGITPA